MAELGLRKGASRVRALLRVNGMGGRAFPVGCTVSGTASAAEPSTHIGAMAGRVKRKAGLEAAAALAARAETVSACALCERPLGTKVEWHHLVPRSEGGRVTAPVHPICHRTIHATLSNQELAHAYADPAMLRAHPTIARYVAWIADKPPDFHAPTRRGR